MNLDRAKAVLHGLSFLSAETISDVSAKRMRKVKDFVENCDFSDVYKKYF